MKLDYHQPLSDRLMRELKEQGCSVSDLSIATGIRTSVLQSLMAGAGKISVEDAVRLRKYWPHNSWHQISGQEEMDELMMIKSATMLRRARQFFCGR